VKREATRVLWLCTGAFAAAVILGSSIAAHAQAPLWVEDPAVLQDGECRFRVGGDYALVGGGIERYRFPSLYWKTGLGGAGECILVFDLGEVNQDGREQGWDVERFLIASKLLVRGPGRGGSPEASLAFGVKIPSSDTKKGVGVDATDFHARLLLARDCGDTRLIANAGLGILEKVTNLWGQDDVFEWGVAAVTRAGARDELLLELSGNSNSTRGPANLLALVGYRFRRPNGGSWDLYARWGLNGGSDNFSCGVGYTVRAGLFSPRFVEAEAGGSESASGQLEELLAGELAHLSDADKQAIRDFFAALKKE